MQCDRVWRNARLATLASSRPGLGIVDDGVVASKDGAILFAGEAGDAPVLTADDDTDCRGRWMTPGLIDCHTHIVHAGTRAREFEQRLKGASYEEIARAGGGIAATVRQTRAASDEALLDQSLRRLDRMIAEGVTTVEIKSGYGLRLDDEARQLRVARELESRRPIRVSPTFLGAHAVPPEFENRADAYIEQVCEAMIPAIAAMGLADAADVFCDEIGFSLEQSRRVLMAAKTAGLGIKIHAEQLSPSGGAHLAAELGALSADHLEYLDDEGASLMAKSGTVAVLLPGAFYTLHGGIAPPVERLRAAGARIAIASDCNPGTSPLTSPLLVMNMAATLFGLTVEECIGGITREAARALGRLATAGSLEAGKNCDLAIWDIEDLAELVSNIGLNPLHARILGGRDS